MTVVIYLGFVQYEAQNANNIGTLGIWFDDRWWRLCIKRLQHCQKVTVVFLTNTYCSLYLPDK